MVKVLILFNSRYGDRRPSDNELEGARFQGRQVASLAQKLASD